MKTNSTLAKKLKAYSALAGVVAVAPLVCDAQVIYTNVEPDTLVNTGGGSYSLDLNGDGVINFKVHFEIYVQTSSGYVTSSSWSARITPAIGNYIVGGSYSSISALTKGDSISPNSKWITGRHSLFAFANLSGDGYLGLNLLIKNQIHYGWARIKVSSDKDYFIVKDYAYNSIPGQMILAGETSCKDSSPVPEIKVTGDTLRAIGLGDIQWRLNGNIIPGYSSNALSPPAQGVYSVIFSDALGCSIQSLPLNFVKCDSILNSISSAGDTEFCGIGMANLSFNYPQYGFNYQWQKNEIDIEGATNYNYQKLIKSSATFRIIVVTQQRSCIDTSDFISYEIHPLPVRPVIIQHNDTLISTKGFKYQWYDLIYHLISGETNQFFIPPQSGYYHVKVKDSLGCESDYNSSYYFDRCYYFAPPPIFRNKEISFCSGILSPGELATVDKLSFSYQWFRNNNGISNSDSSYFMVSDSGDYKVMVTDSAGCSKFTDVEIMYRIKNPSPTIYQEGNILFTGVAQSYQWYQDGVPITGETSKFYLPKIDGNYSVEVKNEAGCSATTNYKFSFCK